MDVIVNARQFELGEALKNFTEQAVHGVLDELTLKISSVRVTLDVQKNTFSAAMTAAVKDVNLTASADAIGDMNRAVTDAAAKLGVQARKYLEKKQDHRDRETLNTVNADSE